MLGEVKYRKDSTIIVLGKIFLSRGSLACKFFYDVFSKDVSLGMFINLRS